MDFWLAWMSKILLAVFSVTQGVRSLSALPAGKAQRWDLYLQSTPLKCKTIWQRNLAQVLLHIRGTMASVMTPVENMHACCMKLFWKR